MSYSGFDERKQFIAILDDLRGYLEFCIWRVEQIPGFHASFGFLNDFGCDSANFDRAALHLLTLFSAFWRKSGAEHPATEKDLLDLLLTHPLNEHSAVAYIDYERYLRSFSWMLKRIRVLERDGNCCQVCGMSGNHCILDVHHKTYKRAGGELLEDLITLCRECHSKFHRPFPTAAAETAPPPAAVESAPVDEQVDCVND